MFRSEYQGQDDDDAQVDGDGAAEPAYAPSVVQFQPASPGMPWLRDVASPPWLLWGNEAAIAVRTDGATAPITGTGQLNKVNYKRPETWHWFFTAQIQQAEDSDVGETQFLDVRINLTIGIGRASRQINSFEHFRFQWGPIASPPTGLLYSNTVQGPLRFVGDTTPNIIDEIVAQDINVSATANLVSINPRAAIVVVTGFFAPKNHIRPDWFRPAPDEVAFQGAEVEGR